MGRDTIGKTELIRITALHKAQKKPSLCFPGSQHFINLTTKVAISRLKKATVSTIL